MAIKLEPGRLVTLLDAVTSGTSEVVSVFDNITNLTLMAQWNGTTSGGIVTFEMAPTADWTGTWLVLGTLGASSGTIQRSSLSNQPFAFVRARISTNVTGGGTVTVYIVGNGL